MNTPFKTLLRRPSIAALFIAAFGLAILSGCATAKKALSAVNNRPPPVLQPPSAPKPTPTAKVVVVNGFSDVAVIVRSTASGKEVELQPLGQAEFPLGTTLIFTIAKKNADVGVFAKSFPAPRSSRVAEDEVYILNDGKLIQLAVNSGIP